jgi:DNA-directed RNA polymerase subunit RPC12/RpoP
MAIKIIKQSPFLGTKIRATCQRCAAEIECDYLDVTHDKTAFMGTIIFEDYVKCPVCGSRISTPLPKIKDYE